MTLDDFFKQTETKPEGLAKALGVTPEAVRLWCRGSRTPRRKMMERIKEETGGAVQPNDFFEHTTQ